MLTFLERIIFIILLIFSLIGAYIATKRIIGTIARGQGKVDWSLGIKRIGDALLKFITLKPTFNTRLIPSLFHALVAWGFMYYVLVNLGDLLEAFISGYSFLGHGTLGGVYRLTADILSVAILVGMLYLVIRRYVFKSSNLSTRSDVLLYPKARTSINRDSAIVAAFIILHVGARFLGESFEIADGHADSWQFFASGLSGLWSGLGSQVLTVLVHSTFWLALGSILLFIPYFLYSKHLHLIMAPINFFLTPVRRSMGELSQLDFEDESIEQFGATKIEDLGWEQLLDAYACIMCHRCQDVCPAFVTGKILSPSALEINKRYFLNYQGEKLARGDESDRSLVEFAIPEEAIWACTSCGACINICPVGNEPMRDIMDIRRSLVLMDNKFPEQLQTAFRGMERTQNPWNIAPEERMNWAEGIEVPRVEEKEKIEYLWWVGCAPSTDLRAQRTARAFAKLLNTAGVNYAVLGEREMCTGDSARRAGNEYLFYEMALGNVELLNEVNPTIIVTTCPHCLHTLKNEYPAFGGNYQVIHHSELIKKLIKENKLMVNQQDSSLVTFHDPCYLSRHNDITEASRSLIKSLGLELVELERSGTNSFCCGAGGAQMWKEEEHGDGKVSDNRMLEIMESGAGTVAVGCPFCLVMLNDSKKDLNADIEVKDIAEVVAEAIE